MSLLELLAGTIAASLLVGILIGFWQHQLANTAAWSQTSALLRLAQRHNRHSQCDPVGTMYAVADLQQAASHTSIEQPQRWRIKRLGRQHLSVESLDAPTLSKPPLVNHNSVSTGSRALLVHAISRLAFARQLLLHTQSGGC